MSLAKDRKATDRVMRDLVTGVLERGENWPVNVAVTNFLYNLLARHENDFDIEGACRALKSLGQLCTDTQEKLRAARRNIE